MTTNTHDRLRGQRVLVVEDESRLAKGLCAVLRVHGAQILGPVSSLAQASRWLAEAIDLEAQDRWPDMVLLGGRLGQERVLPLADALSLLGIPFLFASRDSDRLPQGDVGEPRCEQPPDSQFILQRLAGLVPADRGRPDEAAYGSTGRLVLTPKPAPV
ncbi:response regulator [Rubellimicrobium rubrum]|uniref:Response regulator n=1 Tax=Rubellimicrobium rubrum TaxID=2585369 RepID=A0A5C4MG95_9RHOB|nr:response regulator [Rubellimicrobium rubrum]TNC43083.1 response regulator [Rubellimicrobium rubrum]